MQHCSFASSDGVTTIQYTIWEPADEPIAILQIIHGMSEYVGRYSEFAQWLADQNILVVGDDHIGHGTSSKPEDYGYFGHTDGWKHLVEDEETLRTIMQRQYPDTPYVMLGHSMGSFILRNWLSMYKSAAETIDGAIIMGTAGKNKLLPFGMMLASLLAGLKGEKKKSKFIDNMMFAPYVKPFESEHDINAWLSTDPEVYKAYGADPMAGFPFTLAGYMDLYALLNNMTKENWYKSVPQKLTYLIVSGWDDPVGAFGVGPSETCDLMQDAGCVDVTMILYEGMRHEILNEKDKQLVWDDMRDFILDMADEHGQPKDVFLHAMDCQCEECNG